MFWWLVKIKDFKLKSPKNNADDWFFPAKTAVAKLNALLAI